MIKKFIFTVIALSMTLISCSAQTRLLRDLPTGNGVTKVVVGPAMMKIAGDYIENTENEYRDMFKDIKSIEVYSCENEKIAAEVQRLFFETIKGMNVEQNVMTEEDGEISNIYTIIDEKTGEPSGMIVYTSEIESGEVNIVIMTGKMNLDTLNQQ